MSVEVERKFVCDPEIQKTLKDVGAVCAGQRQFEDQYFDTADFSLTLRDFWLRRRDGCWELKCSTGSGIHKGNGAEGMCSRYREITSVPRIKAEVTALVKGGFGKAAGDHGELAASDISDKWLIEMNLSCFAKFTTQRCSFLLQDEENEGKVRIDLDQADFGYCVGEIEIIVSEGYDVQAALRKIEDTANKLGLTGEQRVQGKMDVYLQRYCPDHYAKLLNAHIL
ncbi:thiamine-triphosphatase [Denticeps clupeoides]|uniref:Thiamine-triphosphatase n=1 Tax=Denticeps clupeoides TaxID=299321 RepID=A0AAY4B9B8_9TELE|nr:thiamine-triphosphatase [Denticeps clupeoides]XP_028821665.1 thiamine-triphosphatase [Denticeps clupeoides]